VNDTGVSGYVDRDDCDLPELVVGTLVLPPGYRHTCPHREWEVRWTRVRGGQTQPEWSALSDPTDDDGSPAQPAG
jgi:hypothetical protein